MAQIVIQTTQNVPISYTIADLGDRIVCALVDLLIKGAYVLAVTLIYWNNFNDSGSGGMDLWGVYAVYALLLTPVMFYTLLQEYFLNGQTIGKKVRNLKVIRLDGSSPDFGNYLLRWLLKPIDDSQFLVFPGLVAILVISISKRGQRLGDIVAGTTVVRLTLRATMEDTILQDVGKNYLVTYPQVNQLSDRDIAIIKDTLEIHSKQMDYLIIEQLAEKVREVLKITTSLPDREFLEVILKDYTQFHAEELQTKEAVRG